MKQAAAWILSLWCAGCSAPEKRQPLLDVALPARWTAADANAAPPVESWWRELGDTNLIAVIERALQRNYDLRAAAARLDAAMAQVRIAGAGLWPSAALEFESRRQQQNFVGLPIPGAEDRVLTSRSTVHAIALATQWELDLWGRIRAGKRAALAELEGSEAELRAAYLSLAAQAAKGWVAITAAKRQLELARTAAENYATTARQVRERYERGLRSPLDLRLALSSAANAEALVSQRAAELQTWTRQLETLMGEYPAALLEPGVQLPAVGPEVPAGVPSDLLERRPDILAAERRLAAADARVWAARAAFFPRISLTASGGRSSSDLADFTSSQFNIWSLAANLVQPWFEGGRLRGGLEQAQARSRELVAAYLGTVLRAFQEVETRLGLETLLEEREQELAEAVEQSRAGLQLAEQRYRAGLEDFVTVLEAQRRSLENESQWIAVKRERLENRIELHLALGGGFKEGSGVAVADREEER